ncbi:hypothetical protein D915_001668 [Fasciola hepatica]|uniref:CUB domain-containing protein n=1 Tax=Fasciola hepatica TaxID=6192 RepID=A0A4E0RF07_FASHE|nr:hypothetical protein D915_001668 [Fasciola hepatica]
MFMTAFRLYRLGCLDGHVPLSLLHAKYFSNLAPSGTGLTSQSDQCGGFWSLGGKYFCTDCVRRYRGPSGCYFILDSFRSGLPSVQLNVTKIGKGDGSDAIMKVYYGYGGRNHLKDIIFTEKSQLYTPVGSMLMIELRLLSSPAPEVSFSFDYKTTGPMPATTGGCGGLVSDSGFISSPGYPNQIMMSDNCVWMFQAGSGLSPSVETVQSDLSDFTGAYALVEIRDGMAGVDPIIAVLNGSRPDRFRGSTRNLFVRYFSQREKNKVGFAARFTSIR